MSLTKGEVAIVKSMLARGDRQSDIAAYFGVNGGRIAGINTGATGAEVALSPPDDLPPPGPYFLSGRSAIHAEEALEALRDLIDGALADMRGWRNEAAE